QLLRATGALAREAGLTVLRGRGSELDRGFSFGVVRQLFERSVAREPSLLDGGAASAAAVFSAAAAGEPDAEDRLYAALRGLHWLTVNLSARGPLVVLADDLHWADAPSLRWLVFL